MWRRAGLFSGEALNKVRVLYWHVDWFTMLTKCQQRALNLFLSAKQAKLKPSPYPAQGVLTSRLHVWLSTHIVAPSLSLKKFALNEDDEAKEVAG